MKRLTLADVAGLEAYERVRPAYREAVIAHKKPRRVPVGDKVTLVFEDRETLRFQIQEMLRIERITRREQIQHELDTYNELLPRRRELSATLFIEITEPARVRPELDRLIGIDEHVFLAVGTGAARARLHADFDPKQLEEDRISAVQYVRFRLDPELVARFADPEVPAAIEIDHPAYQARAPLAGATRESLAATLAGECPALLPSLPEASAGPAALPESERVRVVSDGAGGYVVEALEPGARLEAADPNLAAEVWQALQQVVADLAARGGSCEIAAFAGERVEGLRFHVRPL